MRSSRRERSPTSSRRTSFHTGGIKAASAAHPNARLWGPAGVREKLSELKWAVLGTEPWPFEDALRPMPIEGMPKFNEWAFLHPDSRTLLVSDLVFNITDPKGFGAPLIYSIFGTYRRFAVSRLFLRFVTDRAQFEASLKRLVALDFANLVPSHGDAVIGNAREQLVAALHERKIAV